MPSHTFQSARRLELQAYGTRERSGEVRSGEVRSGEVRPIENKAHAAAIAAKLRSQIPCSTDPAWLEKMAREVESKAHQR